jgi:hypothetical protein
MAISQGLGAEIAVAAKVGLILSENEPFLKPAEHSD